MSETQGACHRRRPVVARCRDIPQRSTPSPGPCMERNRQMGETRRAGVNPVWNHRCGSPRQRLQLPYRCRCSGPLQANPAPWHDALGARPGADSTYCEERDSGILGGPQSGPWPAPLGMLRNRNRRRPRNETGASALSHQRCPGRGRASCCEIAASALVSCTKSPLAFDRRCIPSGGVARWLHTPGMRPPRALPAGRLNGLGAQQLLVQDTRLARPGRRATRRGSP
jgi:hypothetical protein